MRNCNLLPSNDQHGFIDAVDWESIKRQGDDAVKRWIGEQLKGTSVTALLIGAETSERSWIQYETLQSWNRGNGVVGIWIHNIKDQNGKTDIPGRNSLDQFKRSDGTLLSSICNTYDWVINNGKDNLGKWIEEAIQTRAKYELNDKIVDAAEILSKMASVNVVRHNAALAGFAPRSPWCANHAENGR